MKVVGICGSPRRHGNTEILLDKALEGAESEGAETKKYILNTLDFSPCQECEDVQENGVCKVQDDMQVLYGEIDELSGIIVASPVFFGSLSAQTKMMIDRFQCLWLAKYVFNTSQKKLNDRQGAFLCVGASKRNSFFENSKQIIKNFFATIDVSYSGELFCPGVEKKGAVSNCPECLESSFEIGQRIVISKNKD